MAKRIYKLTRWEAIELFTKIIAKYEEKTEEEVGKSLHYWLTEYSNTIKSQKVAEKLIRPIADGWSNQNYDPNIVSNLSNEIRLGKPIIRSGSKLEMMLISIGEEKSLRFFEEIRDYAPKEQILEGSTWWVYTYEYYQQDIHTGRQLGIVRCPAQLLAYGYAIIDTLFLRNGELIKDQTYKGNYSIKNDRYLFIDAHLAETREKDVRGVFDLGIGSIEIGEFRFGYYINVSPNVYFGPLILERIEWQDGLKPQFFKNKDAQIREDYWRFFSGMENIPNELPRNIELYNNIKRFLDF